MSSNLFYNLKKILLQHSELFDIPQVLYKTEEEKQILTEFLNAQVDVIEDESKEKSKYEPEVKNVVRNKQVEAVQQLDENKTIEQLIEDCNKCPDVHERKRPFGSGENGVMVIINAPMMISRVEKKIYKNDSVDLLKKMISAIKLDPEKCYITNLIKCETQSLLNKPSNMYVNCQNILKKEIKEIDPHTIIVMGELLALQKLCKSFPDKQWFNVEHPITLIKNPDLKRKAWSTLQNVIKYLEENTNLK